MIRMPAPIPSLSRSVIGSRWWTLAVLALLAGAPAPARAQGNYEIQVYGSETVPAHTTMFELHSNYTISGTRRVINGVLPTQHAWHETLEITHGFNSWFEVGLYQFTSIQPSGTWDWVGTHLRPRARVPESWHWPVGASLSLEFGYQRPDFSPDTWTLEIRPIVDKELGKWYLAFNPTLERSIQGPGTNKGFEFSPNLKVAYHLTRKVDVGLEYYGASGPITGFDPLREQQQQIYPAVDLDVGKDWEVNFGIGVGFTRSTDHLIAKLILGRRFRIKE